MKTTKLLLIALVVAAMAGSSAIAQTVTRTGVRTSIGSSRTVAGSHHWNHNGHYRSRSNVYIGFGLGYPFGYGYGYGYPYYGGYPYGYGYYTPRYTVYAGNGITDDATVAAVQRRLARGGYYHGSVDGVIGSGTRAAIRAFERNNGLPVDGVIDRQLLRTMGLA
ncbi:MAG TPA: peptidoglycan-binding domain-containing protein [Chthoniobacterales bacterium]|nr:peptidoglycan-binding domain-containing protein [Chthoniobacterales bacterium]